MRTQLVLLLTLPLLAHAQEGSTLGGIVVNSATQEPVRRAVVYARGLSGAQQHTMGVSSTTDATGRFVFAGLAPGRYNISAERSGFVTSNYGARRPGRAGLPLTLEAGKDIQDLILPIVPHGVIAGRVLDEEGEPVAGQQVQVSISGYQNGRRQFVRSASTTTNDLGEYRVYGLAPGKYFVSVAGGGNLYAGLTAQKAADEDYVPVYYPRTTDPSAAIPLAVTPGAQLRDIDLRLTKARTVTVRGHVTMEGLDASTRVSISLFVVGGSPSTNVRISPVSSEGAFEIHGVTPGAYILVASANQRGKAITTRVPVTVGSSNLEGVAAVIRGGTAVEGRLRLEDATEPLITQWKVSLQPFETGSVTFGMLSGGKLDERGAFRLEDVGSERYSVVISGMPEGYYVASMRSGSVDILSRGLETGGGAVAPLEIVVRPNAGKINGTARDTASREPAAGATVVLVPEEKERRGQAIFYRSVTTDGNGRFTMKNLVPGDYRVYAFEDVDYSAWLDPEYLKPFEGRSEKITVREGDAQALQVAVIPADGQ